MLFKKYFLNKQLPDRKGIALIMEFVGRVAETIEFADFKNSS